MLDDLLAQAHRQVQLALHQLVAFELDLAPAHVQRGQELVVEAGRGVGHVGLVEGVFGLVLEVSVLLRIGRVGKALVQLLGGGHAGALAVDGVATRKGKPGLVPQKHQVGFDGRAFHHHPFHVVDQAVEGAVGQQHHAHPAQRAGLAVIEQGLVDVAQAAPRRTSSTGQADSCPGRPHWPLSTPWASMALAALITAAPVCGL